MLGVCAWKNQDHGSGAEEKHVSTQCKKRLYCNDLSCPERELTAPRGSEFLSTGGVQAKDRRSVGEYVELGGRGGGG